LIKAISGTSEGGDKAYTLIVEAMIKYRRIAIAKIMFLPNNPWQRCG
jgi:non-homologous end joining protein Ku